MSNSDTDRLLTFLAAGRQFDHDGQTWTIVEVQHGGTIVAERTYALPDDHTATSTGLFPFDALAGQSVDAQDRAHAQSKRDAIKRLRMEQVPLAPTRGPGEWHPTVLVVDHVMTAHRGMTRDEALRHLANEVGVAANVLVNRRYRYFDADGNELEFEDGAATRVLVNGAEALPRPV